MPLIMVNSVTIRMERLRQFEESIAALAERAVGKKEAWQWTAHQVRFGDARTMHFAYDAEDFAALEKLGTVQELWQRVLGPKRGNDLFLETNQCIESLQHTISIDRPDLSYPPEQADPTLYPLAVVTDVLVRPGHEEACEELIRKIAEAIPKADDPARIVTHQSVVGDLRAYWTVRPLRSLRELDSHQPVPDLLNKAFGAAEGGLIWRTGSEAIAQVQRQIVEYRADLSNPPGS